MTGRGIMIVGAEIVTGIMIEIVDMIGTVIEIAPEVMIQEVAIDRALDLENVLGIMIVTGIISPLNLLVIRAFEYFSRS